MHSRRALLAAVVALWFGAASVLVTAQTVTAGASWGLLIEKGPHQAVATPWLAAEAGLSWPQGSDALQILLEGRTGSLIGTTETLGAQALWAWGAGAPTAFWTPSVGAGVQLDFGDAVFFASSVTDVPPRPQLFAGVTLRPLAFQSGDWQWSLFDLRVLAATSAPLVLRGEVSPFRLVWAPGSGAPVARVEGLSLGISEGASVAMMGNYEILTGNVISPRLDARWGGWEAAVGYAQRMGLLYPEDGYEVSAEVLFSPQWSVWQPGLGVGYQYSSFVFWNSALDADSTSLYLVAKPLQFAFPIFPSWALTVSALELRYSPLFASALVSLTDQGGFLAQVGVLRVGLQWRLGAQEQP